MIETLGSTLRREWARLLFEFIIVVLGISGSLALQDWRKGRQDAVEAQRLLDGFASEIELDREDLKRRVDAIEASLRRIRAALNPVKRATLGPDELDLVMDDALGYNSFSPLVATYHEMRQSGASALIADKELVSQLILLYERVYPRAAEWDRINRDFVLARMFPFVDEHGPSFTAGGERAFAKGYHAVFEALELDDRFRNLLRSSLMFREGQLVTYQRALDAAARVAADL